MVQLDAQGDGLMMLRFDAYWPLLLLMGLPIIAWLARRQRTSLSPLRVRIAAGLRAATLVAITLALMRPALHTPERELAVVYALDVSRSVSSEFLRSALSAIDGANRAAHVKAENQRYVVFGDHAEVVENIDQIPKVAVRAVNDTSATPGAIDQGSTNIEAALTTALFSFPAHMEKHLVLVSDGHQTQGDVWRVAPRLRAQGIRVYTIPATASASGEAWVETVDAPQSVREKENFAVRVVSYARTTGKAKIELYDGQRLLGSQPASMALGRNEVAFETRLNASGRHLLVARLLQDGMAPSPNNQLTHALWVLPPISVLHVEGAKEGGRYLADALHTQGIDVHTQSLESLTHAPQMLRAHDAVILSDVPSEQLGTAIGAKLESYVRDQGGGLIFAAGENSYGKAGFAKSEVERLLPVKFEGKRKRKDIDLVLLIDRSYSMRGRKLEVAKTAALSTLDLLEPQHRLAVVAFDARPHEVVPLVEVGGKRRAEDLISSMTSSGQTNVYHALHYAHQLLSHSPTRTKHVILLSDGISAQPPAAGAKGVTSEEQMELVQKSRSDFFNRWRREHPGQPVPGIDDVPPDLPPGTFEEIIGKFVRDKITLSTVALGENPNLELMTNLAQWSNGKSYQARNDNEIPGLFVAEAQRLLGESLVEERFRPLVKVNASVFDGVDFAAGPELKGLVVSKAKRFSEVLLEGKKELPLLVETRYGLGKTVAFLSDVKNRWAADWLAWPGYARLWSQLVRDVARRDGGQELNWRVTRQGQDALVTLTAFTPEGDFRNGLLPTVRMLSTEAEAGSVLLRPFAPGAYRAKIALPGPRERPYEFELLPVAGVSARETMAAGPRTLTYSTHEEYRLTPADQNMLRALSTHTGGKFAPEMQEIFRHYGDGGTRIRALWQWLVAIALGLYVIDVFIRRAPWGGR